MKHAWVLPNTLVVGLLVLAGGGLVQTSGSRFTTLNTPHAGTASGEGTTASGINQQGDVVGFYYDRNFSSHGFLLHRGRYTALDDPHGANSTLALGINNQG